MKTNDEIIDTLEKLREEQGLSISELARRVDMAKSAVSRYFNRTRQFPLNRADDFAKALDVDTEFLLGINVAKQNEYTTTINGTLVDLEKPITDLSIAYAFLEQEIFYRFGGYEPSKMTAEEILETANEIRKLALFAKKM